jgi:hypothetical protein
LCFTAELAIVRCMRLTSTCVALVRALLVLAASLAFCTPAAAQEAFVAGSAGVCAGAGTSATFSVSGGYLMSRHFGLEVEFSVTPEIEREQLPVPAIQTVPDIPGLPPTVFPGFQIDRNARLYSFHTSAIVPIVEHGRVRVSAVVGGGPATLSERVHVHRDGFELPTLPDIPIVPGLEFPGLQIPTIDLTTETSKTALSLQVGGNVDASVSDRLAVGADVRYQHVFLSDAALDLVRIAARVRWRF